MDDSIFTKIIKGEIPCYKIYEDARTLAFLDIHPIQPGHTLVVSKVQVDNFEDLEEDDYLALFVTVKKVSKILKKVFATNRIGLQIVGLDVPHAHVHLIPFNTMLEFRNMPDLQAQPDNTQLANVFKKITDTI